MPRRRTSPIWMVGGALVAALGLALAISSIENLYHGSASKNWPSTPGTVIASRVDVEVVGGHVSRSGNFRHALGYDIEFQYGYVVAGQQFIGRRVAFYGYSRWPDDFPKDKSIDVYYDPGTPERSVLIPGTRRSTTAAAVIGLVLFAFGIAIGFNGRRWRDSIFIGRKRRRKRRHRREKGGRR